MPVDCKSSSTAFAASRIPECPDALVLGPAQQTHRLGNTILPSLEEKESTHRLHQMTATLHCLSLIAFCLQTSATSKWARHLLLLLVALHYKALPDIMLSNSSIKLCQDWGLHCLQSCLTVGELSFKLMRLTPCYVAVDGVFDILLCITVLA